MHNFYGYLSSVTMQGLAPSPFQMLAFLDAADVVLVDNKVFEQSRESLTLL